MLSENMSQTVSLLRILRFFLLLQLFDQLEDAVLNVDRAHIDVKQEAVCRLFARGNKDVGTFLKEICVGLLPDKSLQKNTRKLI